MLFAKNYPVKLTNKMPELPEVETVRSGLEKKIVNKTINKVTLSDKKLRIPYPKNINLLKGCTIKGVSRRAKYLLVDVGLDEKLVIHLGMSGKILFREKGYKPEKHDHFILDFNGGERLVFNDTRRFGLVTLVDSKELNQHKLFAKLGPEPLLEDFDSNYLYEKLKNISSPIKQAIMNNEVVVGVGNIYACESLFYSGIRPEKAANKVSKKKLDLLVDNIQTVLKDAIESGGSTLRDYVRSDGEMGYFQFAHKVYGREKLPCFTCGSKIKRIVQAGRSSFYCGKCQS